MIHFVDTKNQKIKQNTILNTIFMDKIELELQDLSMFVFKILNRCLF